MKNGPVPHLTLAGVHGRIPVFRRYEVHKT
jgi:hypothetical protein